MKNLHDGGGLRELERLLDGGVHGLVAGVEQSGDGKVEHLSPSKEDGPVVDGEVSALQGSRHLQFAAAGRPVWV